MQEALDELLNLGNSFEKDTHIRLNFLPNEQIYFDRPQVDQVLETNRNGEDHTLLGIAAFHGYLDTVKYLVEVRQADVNAIDVHQYTALEKTVLGDTEPVNCKSYGNQHAQVAQYLLDHQAKMGNALQQANEAKKSFSNMFGLFCKARKSYFESLESESLGSCLTS